MLSVNMRMLELDSRRLAGALELKAERKGKFARALD
jgi:hypothetical protein